MRKLLLFLLVFLVIAYVSFSVVGQKAKKVVQTPAVSPTPTVVPALVTDKILFVPYWTIKNGIENSYNEYVYFGITPDTSGILHSGSGYQGISTFVGNVPSGAKKILGVQLINNSTNESILQDDALQQKIIADSISIAKANGFDGVLLDLEYNAFPFDSVIASVSTFSKRFADGVKQNNLLFYQTVYGDTYYRGRPYTVKDLAKNADKILVMAYDFHKANGDPGANFPLLTGEDEYSFTEMVSNFVKDVPAPKLAIVFGMFGYDWKIDDKGKSIGQADSLSTNEMLQKYIKKCPFTACTVEKNTSLETKVDYEDKSGQKHEVWFEDKDSVSKKEDVVEKNGISSVGFWANGYF